MNCKYAKAHGARAGERWWEGGSQGGAVGQSEGKAQSGQQREMRVSGEGPGGERQPEATWGPLGKRKINHAKTTF
ncbi:hypothetical protein AwEntero_18370 [Enterobacterales bacterium]|nr:hypothetical protein AwEntero_18370 [Enterobacterales bacterium]